MAETTKYLGADIIPAIKAKVEAKQDKLVSGTNIKTVNGESILGSGDVQAAKLYSTYGSNEDGALTQKFASEKMQALEQADTTINETIGAVSGRVGALEAAGETTTADISKLKGYASKTVQLDTAVAEDKSSTVTLVKTTGSLDSSATSTDNVALPVASATQAGVMNPATFQSVTDSAEKVESILGGAVAVSGLKAEASQDELTAAWKQETSRDTLINGAKVLDITNNKTWTYYTNTATWYAQDNTNPEITFDNFTNSAAGIIKGSADVDGKVFAESDGTGSVNGWDTVKSDISSAKSDIEGINSTIAGLGNTYATKSEVEEATKEIPSIKSDVNGLSTSKQDKLVSGTSIKTVNGNSLLGAGDVTIDVPQAMTTQEFEQAWTQA